MCEEGHVSLRTAEASHVEPPQILPYASLSLAGSALYLFCYNKTTIVSIALPLIL